MSASQPPHASPALPQALGHLRISLAVIFTQTSRELGLTPQQAELLCAAMRPAPVGELAAALNCDRTNVTRLADRAAGRGLIRRGRAEADGRVTIITLSDEGRQLAERFVGALGSKVATLFADWSDADQEAAASTVRAVAERLDRLADPQGQRSAIFS